MPGDNPPVTIATPGCKTDIYNIADCLWATADEVRTNSHLKSGEHSIPVLGLTFLKFADSRFTQTETGMAGISSGRREVGKANRQARGVLYLPEESRFARLLQLKETDNFENAINDATAAPEVPAVSAALPQYQQMYRHLLVSAHAVKAVA